MRKSALGAQCSPVDNAAWGANALAAGVTALELSASSRAVDLSADSSRAEGISDDEAGQRRNRGGRSRCARRLSGGLPGGAFTLWLRAGALGCASGAVRRFVPVDGARGRRDRSRRLGRRDHALLVLALQTGLRVSELSTLHLEDLHLGTGAFVHCAGKGRKERATPLTKLTVTVMKDYLAERGGQDTDPVFAGPGGQPLGRDAIRRLVERHAASAARACPSLSRKKPTPHTLRHTCVICVFSKAGPTSQRSACG